MSGQVPSGQVLVIDNYDSFVFNVARYFEELGRDVVVRRNDEIDIAAIRRVAPAAIVLSPGPGTPRDAGISEDVVSELPARFRFLAFVLATRPSAKSSAV